MGEASEGAAASGVDRAEAAAGRACDLYNQLAESLLDVIAALRARGRAEAPLDEDEIGVIRAHQKAIMLVLGYEKDVLKKHGPAAPPREALDLDAARAEVARRLARLRAARDS